MIRFLSKFLYILKGKEKQLIFLMFLFLFTAFMDTLGIGLIGPFIALANNPSVIQKISWLNSLYNFLSLSSYNQFIVIIGLLILSIFYIKTFLNFQVQKYIFRFSYQQKGELSLRLLRSYLRAPYVFHLKSNSALLIQNVINESQGFCNGIMLPLLSSFSYSALIIFLSILLILTSVSASSFVLVILAIPLFLYHHSKKKLSKWGKEASESQTEMIRTIQHSLGGLKETKIIGCEPFFESQLEISNQKLTQVFTSSNVHKLLPRLIIEAALISFLVSLTCFFLLMNTNTQNLMSVLSIFAVASIRFIPSVSQLTNSVSSLRTHNFTLNKLYADLQEIEKSEYGESGGYGSHLCSIKEPKSNGYDYAVMPFNNEIVLKKITYSYPEIDAPALQNIDLTIKKGQSIGIIGKSGAGKTTLVDVVLGLLTPQKGDIVVDGLSIYNNLRSWQNLVGYIPQSIFLMDDTIEKNIAFGVQENLIDSKRLSQAIQAAQLLELVQELPQGIKTRVGERGVRLSGGQRQRIGIARALYHEREILVLDEATSALDNETENLVNESIKSLSGSKTLIVIAHRLTTIEHCNQIYLMEKGQVLRSGNYQEVVLG